MQDTARTLVLTVPRHQRCLQLEGSIPVDPSQARLKKEHHLGSQTSQYGVQVCQGAENP